MVRERRTISERFGSAVADGGLTWGSGNHAVVLAAGLAGVRHPMTDAVLRLKYGNDAKSYPDALRTVVGLANVINLRGGYRMRRRRAAAAAALVLNYWLDDTCHTCTGIGFLVVPGTPVLSDKLCPSCQGTKRRSEPWRLRVPAVRGDAKNPARAKRLLKLRAERVRLIRLHDDLLAALQKLEAATCAEVAKRLR